MSQKPYCTAPWNGLTVREDGSVRTCCPGKVVLGNIKETPIQQIVNNDIVKKIKSDLLSGNPSENCTDCVNFEKTNGVAPIRTHYNTRYPELKETLNFLEIRWNNFCNLTCIYCNEYLSSAWQTKINPDGIKVIRNSFDLDLEEWILNRVDELNELMLVGGEPLLMKQNFQLIDKLADHVRLSIITNLSYDLSTHPVKDKLFNRPADNTIWNVSTESYGRRYEYIRQGANWDLFENNIKLLVENNPNNVGLLMVYGIFSAFTMLDTVKFYHQLGVKKIVPQAVYNNEVLNITNYPTTVVQRAYDELIKIELWQKETYGIDYELYKTDEFSLFAKRLHDIINSIEPRTILTRQEFLDGIAKYDKWHTIKFSELWPEEYNFILNSLND